MLQGGSDTDTDMDRYWHRSFDDQIRNNNQN